jgi:hypothetical protein
MSVKLKNELLAVKAASKDGMLHAEDVVDFARKNKRSELNSMFIWDDAEAAKEYRLWQARRLIQLHVVQADGSPVLVSLSIDRVDGGGYRAIDEVAASRDLMEVLFDDAMKELSRVQAKFQRVQALNEVWSAVDRAKDKRPNKTASRASA